MLNKYFISAVIAFAGFAATIVPADAVQRRDEQIDARAQMMAGKVKSLRSIENRVLPTMSGSQYLGPEFDPVAAVYRLKFIRDGRVVFVDVDGRTGNILSRKR
jgi:hypothetical protein